MHGGGGGGGGGGQGVENNIYHAEREQSEEV